jgi:hypothetical protein
MDLSTIEGLTEAQISAIQAAHDTDVTGLKNKNTELLGKFEGFKNEMTEQERATEEARQAAVKAEAEKQEAQGNYAEAQKLREAERAELVAKAEGQAKKAQDMLKQRDLKDVHFDILGKVDSNLAPAAQAMLNGMTDISYNENGQPIVTIKCGDKEFSSTVDFLAHAETDATWKAMLKAPETKGLNVHNSNAQGSGNSNKAGIEGVRENIQARIKQKFNK